MLLKPVTLVFAPTWAARLSEMFEDSGALRNTHMGHMGVWCADSSADG
jgi:hypothetical protein